MSKSELKKMKRMLGTIKSLGSLMPKKADDKYFSLLEDRIMNNLDTECPIIKTTMVDLIEGTLCEEDSKKIRLHLDSCKECKKEYDLTMSVLNSAEKVNTREEATDDYFSTLADIISNTASSNNELSICEMAQEKIVDELTGQTLPSQIKEHLKSCKDCKVEVERTKGLLSTLKELSVHLPNEQYFEQQLGTIDSKIEELPSHRLARPERKEQILTYIAGIIDTFKVTVMQPQVAIAGAALFALIIIGAKIHYSPESIEERQINLAEVLNRTNVLATKSNNAGFSNEVESGLNIYNATAAREKYLRDSISHPEDDQKLQLRSTGTAKVTKTKEMKRLN